MATLTHEQAAALDALADNASIARAHEVYAETCAKLTAAEQAEPEARTALVRANAARADLVLGSTSGQHVAPEATAAAARAVQDAEHHLTFVRDLATQLRADRQQRDTDLVRAQAQAYRPVAEFGLRLRLAALPRIEAARRALSRAQSDFAEGTTAMLHAEARGFAPRPPGAVGYCTDQQDAYAERTQAAELAYL